jgi:Tol biopolymer transport system component
MKRSMLVLVFAICLTLIAFSCQEAKGPLSSEKVKANKEEIKSQSAEVKDKGEEAKSSAEIFLEMEERLIAEHALKKEAENRAVETVTPSDEYTGQLSRMRIAYINAGDLWVVRADGSDKQRVTKRGDITILFGWSHDDTRLLFGTGEIKQSLGGDIVSGYDLWSLDLNTGEDRRVSDIDTKAAVWVPQRDKIAFFKGEFSVWMANPDGSGQVEIGGSGLEEEPFTGLKGIARSSGVYLNDFSSDGREITYINCVFEIMGESIEKTLECNLMVKKLDTGESIQLTHGQIVGNSYWIPNTKKILHIRKKDEENEEMWIMDSDGKNLTKFPHQGLHRPHIIFSDGKRFIHGYIFTTINAIGNLETGTVRDVIFDAASNRMARPSPDSKYICYVTVNDEINIVDIDGNTKSKPAKKGDFLSCNRVLRS